MFFFETSDIYIRLFHIVKQKLCLYLESNSVSLFISTFGSDQATFFFIWHKSHVPVPRLTISGSINLDTSLHIVFSIYFFQFPQVVGYVSIIILSSVRKGFRMVFVVRPELFFSNSKILLTFLQTVKALIKQIKRAIGVNWKVIKTSKDKIKDILKSD